MSTYGQKPTYEIYNTKGYDLPVKEILGAISARTEYWRQGAQKVKNQYDSTFDFNLTTEENIENLKKQREDADEQLKKSLKTDLSIGDNVTKTLQVFKPILQNQNYIYDEHLTNQLQSGLQQAKIESNKKGTDYYHQASVQALSNSIEKLRTRKSDPNTGKMDYSDLMNDNLGTNYIPYDPKVKKDWEAQKLKYRKELDTKYATPTSQIDANGNPAFYISEKTMATQKAKEWQDYISQNEPEQEKTHTDLQAKNLQYDLTKYSKLSPETRKETIDRLSKLRATTFNSQQSLINTQINQLNEAILSIADPTNLVYKSLQDQKTNLLSDLKTLKLDFDNTNLDDIIDNSHRGNEVLSNWMNILRINSEVEILGLDRTKEELKADTSRSSIYIARLNNQNKLDIAQIKEGKKAEENDASASNPNIGVSQDLNETNNEKPEDIINQIQNKAAIQTIDITKEFLTAKGFTLDVNGKPTDLITALESGKFNGKTVEQFLNEAPWGPDKKQLFREIVANAYYDGTNKKNRFESFANYKIGNGYIENRVKAALSNQKVFTQILQRLDVTEDSPLRFTEYQHQLQLIESENKYTAQHYGEMWKNSAKNTPLEKIFEGKTYDDILKYSEQDFANDISKTVKLTPDEVEGLKNYSRTGVYTNKTIEQKVIEAKKANTPGIAQAIVHLQQIPPHLQQYFNQWKTFQDNLKTNIQSGDSTPLANTTTYSVKENEADKNFDKYSHITPNQLTTAFGTATTIRPGSSANTTSDLEKAFGAIRGSLGDKDVINSIRVYTPANSSPYIRIGLNLEKSTTLVAKIEALGVKKADAEEFVKNIGQTKIFISPETAQKYFYMGGVNQGANEYARNHAFYYKLSSGNEIILRNSSTDNNTPLVDPVGKFKYFDINDFQIKEQNASLYSLSQNPFFPPGMYDEKTLINNSRVWLANINNEDYKATLIQNLLQGTTHTTKLEWDELSKENQTKLKKLFPKDFANKKIK